MLKSRIRLVFAVLLLVISIAALVWSVWPGARVVRRQLIEPTEMQLPTPSGYVPSGWSLAGLDFSQVSERTFLGVDRFVFIC